MKLLIAIFLITSITTKMGDRKPFCYFPEYFSTTVQPINRAVDLSKYMGTWYEILRLENVFERDCACGEAHYSLENNQVNIENVCIKKDGTKRSAKAKGYSKNEFNSFLKIYFNPIIGGNYFILDLDPNYQWVVIGEPCKDMFWILSRTNDMHHDVLQHKIQFGKDLGFDMSKAISRGDTCNENLVEF